MSFREFVASISTTVNGAVMPLLYALAFFFFLFGVARLFFSDSDEKRTEGRKFAIWGIIALAVMFGIWGIIRVLLSVITG
jgi:hypothetical protein